MVPVITGTDRSVISYKYKLFAGSQFSENRTGVMWADLPVRVMMSAAAF